MSGDERPSIKDVLKEGQELIVQVEKIERGNKGAALTTYITLAGSFLVLMPTSPKAGGVSRRIEGTERTELVEILKNLETPDSMGIIVRTASVGHTQEELQWDLDILVRLWSAIQNIANQCPAPVLIHQESNAMIRALRDYLRPNLDEIVVDGQATFDEAKKYIELIRPDFVEKVKFYDEKQPLFSKYKVEEQVESIFRRELRLPSGGSLAVDQTEALVAIDINSSRATKGSDIEETAFNTNLEAADEIARQLRLRDIGGLIVIDFIDMMQNKHQREVEERLSNALFLDRAKVQIGRISRFGLLEMSRQRLRSTLSESTKMVCPCCQGQGNVRSIPSLSLSILRNIEEQAIRDDTAQIRAHLPNELATYLLNEKRGSLKEIEEKHDIRIHVIPHAHFQAPHYELERTRKDERQNKTPSYKIAENFRQTSDANSTNVTTEEPITAHQPALQTIDIPNKPQATERTAKSNKPGLLTRLFQALFGKPKPKRKPYRRYNNTSGRKNYNNRGRNNQRNNNNRRNNTRGNRQNYRGNSNRPSSHAQGNTNNDRGSNKTS